MSASQMSIEADQAAGAVRRLLATERASLEAAAKMLAAATGPVTTAARGSSDHAMTAFKYACEIMLGRPVASIGPSVASVYGTALRLTGGLHLTVSQSGASPDIVALQATAAGGGAKTIAVVNVADSPLARAADRVVSIQAGEEKSVAATKSFIASCAALFAIVAGASGDQALKAGLAALPDALDALAPEATDALAQTLAKAQSLYVTGRGPAFGIALEAALKAKETAGIHAEAFSSAELMHGPLQLVQPGFPVVVFAAQDASFKGMVETIDRLRGMGGVVLPISTAELADGIRTPSTGHAVTDTLVFVLAWYRAIEKAALLRGLDPDRPANLRKVTETV
ncbi:SIS domain-containing protein [Chelativorans sp. ZYF759]|uniref:SIS domain-containing protein n=1 Tax=Chelativorans sp. ZYF759 TaxID=2692213 RepID=UPI00145DC49A|nr:SIS domain-containing protein [Chelativorans sp. ZYF759]NMG40682.1 SIS domain-containing protein [Chelativorans sp. ZYF759]